MSGSTSSTDHKPLDRDYMDGGHAPSVPFAQQHSQTNQLVWGQAKVILSQSRVGDKPAPLILKKPEPHRLLFRIISRAIQVPTSSL